MLANKIFDFSNFLNSMESASLPLPSEIFLCWLLGFSEGDGCFAIIKKHKSCAFVISQSTQDVQVLHYIRDQLGFGKVIAQGKRSCKYVVQDKKNLKLIVNLFNGNLVFPRQRSQFAQWLSWGFPDVLCKGSCVMPSLKNAWLSGLTDAEGYFSASFLSNSNACRLRFILSQKGDENLPVLSTLITLFNGGNIKAHSQKSNYSYCLLGVNECYAIYSYFSRYPLVTRKQHSYKLWQSLHLAIRQKKHLMTDQRSKLMEKAKLINSVKRKSQ